MSTTTITATGSGNFTVPAGVWNITAECWGGGGAGLQGSFSSNAFAGGGGGAYAKKTYSVTPGDVFSYSNGAGNPPGVFPVPANPTWFSSVTSCYADPGTNGGVGGSTSLSFGDTKFSGGNGGTTTSGSSDGGGGGGGSGGDANNGGNGGSVVSSSTGGAGGTAGSSGGATGGKGGNANQAGAAGSAPGAGGGGTGGGGVNTSGSGADGQIKITYIVNPTISGLGTTAANSIAFDATANSGVITTTPSSISWSHTCTGNNLILIIGVGNRDKLPVSVKYAGVPATLLNNTQDTLDTYSSLWYVRGPSPGANTVLVNFGSGVNQPSGGSMSFTGVDPDSPIDSSAIKSSDTGGGAQVSVTTTTVADNCWLVGVAGSDSAGALSFTLTAPDTQAWNVGSNAGGVYNTTIGSYFGPKTPAGSKTLACTGTGVAWAAVYASIKPAGTNSTIQGISTIQF